MKFITEEEARQTPKKRMETVFATDLEGKIYEIPVEKAEGFVVSEERIEELGHLPLFPYDKLVHCEVTEVGGRHGAPALIGQGMIWHERWLIGPYIWWRDQCGYFGPHMHPWRTYLAHDNDDL